MFGYIKPFKPQMKFCEFDIYQSVYCGLCKQLSKEYGFFPRFMLSYDFVFLGLLELSIKNCKFGIEQKHCIAHPLRKTKCISCIGLLDYSSASAVISIYHKIRDDIADKGFFKKIGSALLLPFFVKGYKKAKEKYPDLCNITERNMKVQSQLEKVNCRSIDIAAEPTANIMSAMSAGIAENTEMKNKLARFGYLLGRYVYITDALEDYKKDVRTHSYNTLYLNEPDFEKAKDLAQDSVFFTLSELAECYINLEIENFKPIMDNIIYLGLKNVFFFVKNERRIKKDE